MIQQAYTSFKQINVKIAEQKELEVQLLSPTFSISKGDESWHYDNIEEFLAEYPKADDCYFSQSGYRLGTITIDFSMWGPQTSVTIDLPNRKDIESIFQIFENNLARSKIKIEPKPLKIFIGHGHSNQWRDLKDHLSEQHGFEVIAYEVGPRAGLDVKEVLESMLDQTSFALLVLTGEDIHQDGEMHARENVIHELGLFQGSLGFRRAIALLENDVKQFSNILGINQLRFSKDNIREIFGDVVATINREMKGEND